MSGGSPDGGGRVEIGDRAADAREQDERIAGPGELGATLGAVPVGPRRCRFRVWAPGAERVDVRLLGREERTERLRPERRGYFAAVLDGVPAGALYRYRLDGETERPDPASRRQPRGVHGPSQVVDVPLDGPADDWRGLPLEELVLYELHIGTFSEEGTFGGALRHLDRLETLGVTAVELMPVAQFPGRRNWGYDGVYPYAVQDSYGGPEGMRRFVSACHERGLAVILDVVYNHLGPEGCYLQDFGPYFTDRYRTPWGRAINFDGSHSDEVRRYFAENALQWISGFGIDGLRLDAIHGIVDPSPRPFLEELADAVHGVADRDGREIHLIAENDRNDPRVVRDPDRGGHGLDGFWNDDFHHALHAVLTGERTGYYRDYGDVAHVARALREGFVYSGQYSRFRRRRHGRWGGDVSPHRMVVFAQNHDQVGNRPAGERLSDLVGPEKLKLAAAATLLSPFLPLLFMGEEYGEPSPFPYFVDHSDPDLLEAVREGRRRDFAGWDWSGPVPEPDAVDTFESARLDHERRQEGWHRALLRYHRALIRLRRRIPWLPASGGDRPEVLTGAGGRLVTLRAADRADVLICLHFGREAQKVVVPLARGTWERRLDSSEEQWTGPGTEIPERIDAGDGADVRLRLAPHAAVVLSRTGAEPRSPEGGP